MIKKIALFTIIILIAVCITCYAPDGDVQPEVAEPQVFTASIMAVGDNLIHNTVYSYGQQPDGSYNFDFLFENISDSISSADISVINQETILVDDRSQISNYPTFGTPAEMADAVAKAGFDVVLHATNHTYDKGMPGINASLRLWRQHPEITLLGIHDSPEQDQEITIIERNSIKFSMLNYTYGLNGFSLPDGYEYAVDLLTDREKVLSDVARAESMSDVSVVFLHIGDENTFSPSEYTRQYVNDVIDAGADIVICAHTHTLQPYGMVTAPSGKSALVYYSLGNFHSGQVKPSQLLGGMANVTVKKTVFADGSSDIDISDFSLTPLVTHFDGSYRSTFPLSDYSDDLGGRHTIRGMSTEELWRLYNSIINNEK